MTPKRTTGGRKQLRFQRRPIDPTPAQALTSADAKNLTSSLAGWGRGRTIAEAVEDAANHLVPVAEETSQFTIAGCHVCLHCDEQYKSLGRAWTCSLDEDRAITLIGHDKPDPTSFCAPPWCPLRFEASDAPYVLDPGLYPETARP